MSTPAELVPREALAFLSSKRLQVGFDYRDVWREEHATAFTVAKITETDVLASVKTSLETALKEGQSFATWRKNLKPELAKAGWWGNREAVDPITGEIAEVDLSQPRRLQTIYDTNIRTANAAGSWDRIQRTKRFLPYLLYTVGPSAQHRPEHLAWHGTLLPADDPWWQTHFAPNGWGCKCSVRQVGRAEFERMTRDGVPGPGTPELDSRGVPTGRLQRISQPPILQAPSLNPVPWKNKRTGATELVPKGIDPGFDTNPGASRAKQLQPVLVEKQQQLQARPALPPTRSESPRLETLDDWIGAGDEILQGLTPKLDGAANPQTVVLETLSVRRPLATTMTLASSGKASTLLKRAATLLPKDWIAASDSAGECIAKTKGTRAGFGPLPNGRGYFELPSTTTVDVALHELTHRMQQVMPSLDKLFQDIHKRRTTGNSLEVLYPSRPAETGRPDGYVSRYQGREYRASNVNGGALEVITMAIQYTLGGNPEHFAQLRSKDPEMLKLTLAALWHFKP